MQVKSNGMIQKAGSLRYALVALLLTITIVNYLDRQSLSILAPIIQRELVISDREYAHIVSAFLVTYTLGYLLAGWITDWLGSRVSTAIFVLWWSVAEIVPAVTSGALGLGFARAMLGLGEAGIWVAGPKVVGEWFEKKDRGTVIGIYTAGATIGATLAPPIVLGVQAYVGWRSVFVVSGVAGFLWLIPWLLVGRRLARSISRHALETHVPMTQNSFGLVLRRRTTWLLVTARFLTDPVWYFFLFWYPKYLVEQRHQPLRDVARFSWMVYLAADIGTLIGGFSSGVLIRRGMNTLRARKLVMVATALLLPLSPIVVFAHSLGWSYGIASIIAFAHMAWLVTLTTIIVDQYSGTQIATAAGVIAAGSGLGGILSSELLGVWLHSHSYQAVFLLMGVLHPIALFLVLRLREADVVFQSHTDPVLMEASTRL